uniref:Lysozyme n=1 Tax=Sus scrofa TaxID=9823 RepID=A0A8D0SJ79_PIG
APQTHLSFCFWRTQPPQLTLCSSLTALITDDLTDAIICAKKIVKETEGMNYWQGWKNHCEGKDLSEWKKGCEVS